MSVARKKVVRPTLHPPYQVQIVANDGVISKVYEISTSRLLVPAISKALRQFRKDHKGTRLRQVVVVVPPDEVTIE